MPLQRLMQHLGPPVDETVTEAIVEIRGAATLAVLEAAHADLPRRDASLIGDANAFIVDPKTIPAMIARSSIP